MKKAAIVGIDAGTKTAVAALGLGGEVVKLSSRKNFSLAEVLSFISAECVPVMIASDVSAAPKLLHKVAAAFSLRVHEPPWDLSRKAKSRLLRPYGLSGRDKHKKDAMAAAVSAYRSVTYMLDRIDRKLSGQGITNDYARGSVARRIITGESGNITSAIKSVCEEEVHFTPETVRPPHE